VHRITMQRHARGFTLIEIMVAIVILSILLAVGIPSMRGWMTSTRAVSAAEFYAEGMRLARAEALKRNVASRLVLTTNAANGQQDWQVDICVPTPDTKCTAKSGTWSTTTTALTATGTTDFKSVFRSAGNLPATGQMAVSVVPKDADTVYFTSVGWVDGTVDDNLTQIVIAPSADNTGAFPTTAVYLTSGGSLIKCNPSSTVMSVGAKDSRKCPTTT
jgi:type IV fimbrial biogenesis protein FimT